MCVSNLIISGLVGGIISSLLYPIITHLGIRYFNKLRVSLFVDEHDPFNCRVLNKSFLSLRNVIAYITINNDKNDLIQSSRIQVFCSDKKVVEDRLSWSKNIDGKNISEIDIHQGESQKLNLIRYHENDPRNAIEVASEQGFFDENINNKSRAVLFSNRDYIFEIKLIADNLAPIKKKFIYNYLKHEIIEL